MLDVSGRLSSGAPAESFLTEAREAIGDGKARLLINLEEVPYIDSMGLESLIEVYNAVRATHGDVRLLSPSAKVAELMRLTKLSSVFGVYTDEATAIEALTGPAAAATD